MSFDCEYCEQNFGIIMGTNVAHVLATHGYVREEITQEMCFES